MGRTRNQKAVTKRVTREKSRWTKPASKRAIRAADIIVNTTKGKIKLENDNLEPTVKIEAEASFQSSDGEVEQVTVTVKEEIDLDFIKNESTSDSDSSDEINDAYISEESSGSSSSETDNVLKEEEVFDTYEEARSHNWHLSRMLRFRGQEPGACNICHKKYYPHVPLHIEKDHKCQFCDQAFQDRETLFHHIRRHIGESDYICNICGEEFSETRPPHGHVRAHFKNGKKCYPCSYCRTYRPKGYSSVDELNAHIQLEHPEQQESLLVTTGWESVLKLELLECPNCDMLFKETEEFKQHQKDHLIREPFYGGSPFQCAKCGGSGESRYQMSEHVCGEWKPERFRGPRY